MSLFGLGYEKIALFAVAVFVLAVTPGPVWIYLISRTLVQGRRAGYFSILGVQVGVAVHVIAAALGLSAIALAIPVAYDAIKLAGACASGHALAPELPWGRALAKALGR